MTTAELIEHVEGAIAQAAAGESLMSEDVNAIRGFSTPAQRRLVNNLCRGLTRYLEVGLYAGATFCGAASNNPNVDVIGIDDRSQTFSVDSVWDELDANLAKFKGDPRSMTVIFDRSWEAVPKVAGPIQMFYYDGEHSRESQAKALPAFVDLLDRTFILKIDDWDWEQVRQGTADGFAACADKVKIVRQWVLTEGRPDGPLWHNGIMLAVCEKL